MWVEFIINFKGIIYKQPKTTLPATVCNWRRNKSNLGIHKRQKRLFTLTQKAAKVFIWSKIKNSTGLRFKDYQTDTSQQRLCPRLNGTLLHNK